MIDLLLAAGAEVVAHDPAISAADEPLKDRRLAGLVERGLTIVAEAHEPARDADVLALLTEWGDYRDLDPEKVADLMAHPAVVDTRNVLDRDAFLRRGFRFLGSGR